MSEPSSRNQRTTEPAATATSQAPAESASPPASKPAATAKHLLDVDAVLFRAANECRSFEDVRYYLNGVYVHPHPVKGVLLVGTDGHRLMCVHDESGSCTAPAIVIVPPKALANVRHPKKSGDARARLAVLEDKHVIVGEYRSLKPALIDGTFPDYVRVLTPMLAGLKKRQSVPASFRPEYLAAFCKISDILRPGVNSMRLISTSESDAALVLFGAEPKAFGVLMPMRSNLSDGFPAWMQPVLEPPTPAAKKPVPKKKANAKPAKRAKASARKKRAR